MLFFSFIIIAVLSMLLMSFCSNISHKYYYSENDVKKTKLNNFIYDHDDGIIFTLGVVLALNIVAIIVSIIIIAGNNLVRESNVAQGLETQKALKYKVESESCKDEFGLLSKEIIDELQAWNSDLAKHKKLQRDLWLGIYTPNIYDNFEIIDYENYVK